MPSLTYSFKRRSHEGDAFLRVYITGAFRNSSMKHEHEWLHFAIGLQDVGRFAALLRSDGQRHWADEMLEASLASVRDTL